MNEVLSNLERNLPMFATTNDLIDMGLFTDHSVAAKIRHSKTGPEWIRLGRKILYPKDSVIRFVREQLGGKRDVITPATLPR